MKFILFICILMSLPIKHLASSDSFHISLGFGFRNASYISNKGKINAVVIEQQKPKSSTNLQYNMQFEKNKVQGSICYSQMFFTSNRIENGTGIIVANAPIGISAFTSMKVFDFSLQYRLFVRKNFSLLSGIGVSLLYKKSQLISVYDKFEQFDFRNKLFTKDLLDESNGPFDIARSNLKMPFCQFETNYFFIDGRVVLGTCHQFGKLQKQGKFLFAPLIDYSNVLTNQSVFLRYFVR